MRTEEEIKAQIKELKLSARVSPFREYQREVSQMVKCLEWVLETEDDL